MKRVNKSDTHNKYKIKKIKFKTSNNNKQFHVKKVYML